MEEIRIREFSSADTPQADDLWKQTPGVGVGSSDSVQAIETFLLRNPGLSFVAMDAADACVGTLLSGHDGRRGYLYHLAVHPDFRRRGIGRALVERALDGLKQAGISKVHLFVFADNELGKAFWRNQGWLERDDLQIMSQSLPNPD